MSLLRRAGAFALRALKMLFHLLYLLVRLLFVLLLLIIPIPILLKPEASNPYRRNQVTQLDKKRVPD
jgi:hypothetical protein